MNVNEFIVEEKNRLF